MKTVDRRARLAEDRVRAALVAVVPVRMGLDLAWPLEVDGIGVQELGGAVVAVAPFALALARWRVAATHPLRWPMAVFGAALAIGAVRADAPADAFRYGLHLAAPIGWLLAIRAWGLAGDVPAAWRAAAAVPVALSIGALALGQPERHVLHGWPRLVGAYGNLHTHAASVAVFTATSASYAALRRDPREGALAAAAGLCTLLTWVRGAFLWVGLAIGLVLVVARRRGGAALVAVAAVAALVLLRARWADAVALLSLTPPAGGWEALGSWRVRIWTDSLATFLSGPTADVWLGRGLGGQYGLHRHLDPHSEVLSLLYQLGPLGLGAWLAWVGAALVALWRRRAAVAFGLLAAAALVGVVGNDFLLRATVVLWTWGAVGFALAAVPDELAGEHGGEARREGDREVVVDAA